MPVWIKEYNPELISERMEKVKIISDDGKVSFSGFEHSEHVVLLNSMIKFNKEIPEIEKRRIINQATFIAGAKGAITPKSLLGEINTLECNYLSTPEQNYRLLTDISISNSCQIPTVYFEGSSIIVHAPLNVAAKTNRKKMVEKSQYFFDNNIPKNYAPISVTVKGRSTAEAADKALDRLDFIRGVWNLFHNRKTELRMSMGSRDPVNQIILGPLHTLHHRNGTLATESWWYESKYRNAIKLYNGGVEIDSMQKFMLNFCRLLRKSAYKQDIVHAVLRYVRALDTGDWDDSFLRLWGVLEFLTGSQADGSKVTIRRTSYMFSDREYVNQVLSHLRDYRNKSVHEDSESGDIESLMYQLKHYVERLIEFHVANKFCFSSITDAAKFLDSPNEKEAIDKQISRLRYAKKFISG